MASDLTARLDGHHLYGSVRLDGRRVPFKGDRGNVRAWLRLRDHWCGLGLVLRSGRVPGIGGSAAITKGTRTAQPLKAVGTDRDTVGRIQDRKDRDLRCVSSLRSEFGREPRLSVADGEAATAARYRGNGARRLSLKASEALA
ncbi:hypothetical protein AB0442_34755 [Kitasatospora sp. NPDC085895]|uniref:hypothetical protein n=1 Tax=Kitasatospora sp. NPDC085895 TaxID=3155057 RepID=UPI00344F9B80